MVFSGNRDTELKEAFCLTQPYTSGTIKSAANVEATRPPITARPKGAD